MSTQAPDHAFILAAGKGTRLRPYTDSVPKPLVPVAGRPIIDHALDKLAATGVSQVTVNTHYLAPLLRAHLERRTTDPTITLSQEDELLDTGGAIKKVLSTMGDKPFYVIAGDALWTDGPSQPALERLAQSWDPDKMDILLLLQPLKNMTLTQGVGDYDIDENGRAVRRKDKSGTYMWTNLRINKPEIFHDAPAGSFSFLELLDKAEEAGRLYALIHDGVWHHISTPADLERVNTAMAAQKRSA